jgi:hypothetical protein
MSNPFRYFNSSPEVIRLVVMMYVRYPLSLRNVEDLLAEWFVPLSSIPVLGAISRGVALRVDGRSCAGCAVLIIKSNGF